MRTTHNTAKLIGKRFGRLTVVKRMGSKKNRALWLCSCLCGGERVVNTNNLCMGKSTSCGCYKKSIKFSNLHKKHGFRTKYSTKEQKVFLQKWTNMRNRCTNKKTKDYKYYGGRGIKIFWHNFEDFKKDMWGSFLKHLKKFSLKETTIDRIDFNGHYCKENCRWVNQSIQVKNRRNLRIKK